MLNMLNSRMEMTGAAINELERVRNNKRKSSGSS